MLNEYVSIALNSLKHRKIRSWLTIIGIIIGIAAIISLISLGQGLENAINEQFEKMGISSIRVVPGELRGPPTGSIGFDSSIIDKVEKVKSVEYVNPVLLNYAALKHKKQSAFVLATGYDTSLSEKGFLDIDIKIKEGRLFRKSDENNKAVLLGYTLAKDTFDPDIEIGKSIEIEDEKFEVIGIFEKQGQDLDNRIYMPIETMRLLYNKPDTVNALTVKILPGITLDKAAKDIENELRKTLDEDEFEVFTPEKLLDQINSILGILKIVLTGIASISLLVGGIGIMNSMYTSVLQRTKDIGIMKSIGAKNIDILNMFLLESGLIGLFGGALGIALGTLVAKSVERIALAFDFTLLKITIDVRLILFALSFSFIIGIISGILPAIRAAKLKPTDALRYE